MIGSSGSMISSCRFRSHSCRTGACMPGVGRERCAPPNPWRRPTQCSPPEAHAVKSIGRLSSENPASRLWGGASIIPPGLLVNSNRLCPQLVRGSMVFLRAGAQRVRAGPRVRIHLLQRRVSCEPEFRGRIPSRPWGIFSRLLRVAIGGTAFRDRHPALRCPPILSRR